MRRVVMLTSVHPHEDVRIYHKEARALAAAGYQVTIVNRAWTGEREGIRFVGVPTPNGRAARMAAWKRYAQAALAQQPDVCHLHDPELLPAGLWLKRRGVRVVYDAHEDLPLQVQDKPWIPCPMRGPAAWCGKQVEQYAARRLDGVICATQPIAARFQTVNKQVAVVRNLPKCAEFPAPIWGKRERAVCYVGALTKSRGIQELAQAAKLAGVPLYLAGRFEDEASAHALLQGTDAHYLGVLGRGEVAELLNRCLLGAVTLHPTAAYVESIPIKLLEYMAAGMAVVASNFPYWRQLVGISAVRYVNPMDITALANALQELANHPQRAEQMGRAGRALVEERLNWEREQHALQAFYTNVCKEAPASRDGKGKAV